MLNLTTLLQIKKHRSLDVIGSRIVGAPIARNDIEQFYKEYPALEEIAELGADLEMLKGSSHESKIFLLIQRKLQLLNEQMNNNADAKP